MHRIAIIVLLAGIFGFIGNKTSFAVTCEGHSSNQQGKISDAGNKICPVTGEKIEEKAKATYVYEGKVYNFCCAACIDDFKKDPEKYIRKIEEEKGK